MAEKDSKIYYCPFCKEELIKTGEMTNLFTCPLCSNFFTRNFLFISLSNRLFGLESLITLFGALIVLMLLVLLVFI